MGIAKTLREGEDFIGGLKDRVVRWLERKYATLVLDIIIIISKFIKTKPPENNYNNDMKLQFLNKESKSSLCFFPTRCEHAPYT